MTDESVPAEFPQYPKHMRILNKDQAKPVTKLMSHLFRHRRMKINRVAKRKKVRVI